MDSNSTRVLELTAKLAPLVSLQ